MYLFMLIYTQKLLFCLFKLELNDNDFFLAHKYHSRHEFVADVEQILQNCVIYNGKDSPYTQKAEALVKTCRSTLEEVSIDSFNLCEVLPKYVGHD